MCTGSVSPAFTNAVGGTWSISNGTGSATITAGGVVTGVLQVLQLWCTPLELVQHLFLLQC